MAAAAVISFRTGATAPSNAAGDDGSNTDSGRGLSEEDVAELPPSVIGSSCAIPTGSTFGVHQQPEAEDARRCSEAENSCSEQQLQHKCIGRREALVNRSSSSGSATSAATTGFDTGKRVRFQTHEDSDSCGVDRYRGNGGGQQLGAASVWRRMDKTGDGFSRGGVGSSGRRWRTRPATGGDGIVGRLRIDDSYNDQDDDDDDGGTTTTSGSYDPAELCSEIDRVFFAHNTPI